MSTAENEAGNRVATIEALEGHPESRAFDIESVERGLVLVGVNVDGERRRMFVSHGLIAGLQRAVTPTITTSSFPAPSDAYLEERVGELENEVERERERANDWRGMAEAMWAAAGRPATQDPPLDRWQNADAARVISNIVAERDELRDVRGPYTSRPYGAIANALGIDPRSTLDVVLTKVKGLVNEDPHWDVSSEDVTAIASHFPVTSLLHEKVCRLAAAARWRHDEKCSVVQVNLRDAKQRIEELENELAEIKAATS